MNSAELALLVAIYYSFLDSSRYLGCVVRDGNIVVIIHPVSLLTLPRLRRWMSFVYCFVCYTSYFLMKGLKQLSRSQQRSTTGVLTLRFSWPY